MEKGFLIGMHAPTQRAVKKKTCNGTKIIKTEPKEHFSDGDQLEVHVSPLMA